MKARKIKYSIQFNSKPNKAQALMKAGAKGLTYGLGLRPVQFAAPAVKGLFNNNIQTVLLTLPL